MAKNLDPRKHPFSAALYNKPQKRRGGMGHDWGGGHDEYVGRHRKGGKGCALVLLAMGLPIVYGIAEWLA